MQEHPPASPAPALPEVPDTELLQAWVRDQNQRDFTEIVRRHLGLVRGIAGRQVGPDLAEDVTQIVFAILARKASGLASLRSLAAWLHHVTLLQCRSMVRRRIRERRNHQSAMENASLADARDPLSEALPLLDAAIGDLPDSDRELIHLRYSEGLSFNEVARRTGRSEPALRQQTSRALTKLGGLLKRRGVAVSVSTLAAGLGTTLTGSSSASATSVASTAVATSGKLGGGLLAYISFFTMTTNQTILAGAALALLLTIGPVAWQANEIQREKHPIASMPAGEGSNPATSSSPRSTSATARSGRGKAVSPPSADEKQKQMGQLMGMLVGQAKDGLSDWLRQTAEIDALRTAAALKLSPAQAEALKKLLFEQAASTADNATNDDEDGEPPAKKRAADKAARDAWFVANLTPEQKAAHEQMLSATRAATAEKLAGQALYEISSSIALSDDQKTALFDAAAAKATTTLEKGDVERSFGVGVNISRDASVPVEEASGDLLATVLDTTQQELWGKTVARDSIFRNGIPKLIERALPLLEDPEVQEAIANPDAGNPAH